MKGNNIWKKIWNRTIQKLLGLNLLLTLLLNLLLEFSERRSPAEVLAFVHERTFVFLYNGFIIFMCLCVVFLVKKKIFTYVLVSGFWVIVAIANAAVLSNRKTPFTAVDLTIVKSTLPILGTYLEIWQIVLLAILAVAVVVGLVCLYLYSPENREDYDFRGGLVLTMIFLCIFSGVTYVGVGKGMLIKKFDNLIAGYKDYGVAYGFCVTAIDTGIDRPMNYSKMTVSRVKKKVEKKEKMQKAQEAGKPVKRPNIIFLQLESFFDATTVKNLKFSEDPIPTFRKIQKEYTSGYLKVPVYGAGTINTEFEVISGMNLDYFGTGEYPYRSILHKTTCDSIAYWLSEINYEPSVIHNNNASFYDRDTVFSNLGFRNFITIENMNVKSRNAMGWAKDEILIGNIMDTLEKTRARDVIYAISVQGHGDYPTEKQEDSKITVTGDNVSESYLNQFSYYAGQTREMDDFIKNLLQILSDYPEDTMVIAYGDHLPGMNLENKDLKSGSKYETPYFIWDNFGYNKKHREKESGDVEAWQLAAKVLGEMKIHNGFLNEYHQTMSRSKNYRKNLKLLQYDMLYGSNFVREGKNPLLPTTIHFSLNPVEITGIKEDQDSYFLLGKNFTDASRVYVSGIPVPSEKKSSTVLKISRNSVKEGEKITVHQVSVTNEKITLNHSDPYEFHKDNVRLLYKNLYDE
ncbi:MAG: LTA synthase family protein [Lachnospiraceae bacterium]|nr:LTA synthase family protein [Lachnospiraceae bacterium]